MFLFLKIIYHLSDQMSAVDSIRLFDNSLKEKKRWKSFFGLSKVFQENLKKNKTLFKSNEQISSVYHHDKDQNLTKPIQNEIENYQREQQSKAKSEQNEKSITTNLNE